VSDFVESPCVGVCRMDPQADVCAGCFRTREEIASWSSMTSEQKSKLNEILAQRLAESVSFD
jgi:predicted Fe-S protein YdhL (DUF1289 family)